MQRSAKLIDDASFITAQEKVSQFPFTYHTDLPPNHPIACTTYAGGCKQQHVTDRGVDTLNQLLPGWTRTHRSASTELFGGPFKARGDGALMNPDALSAAWTPIEGYEPHCSKKTSEIQGDSWYNCADVKLGVEEGSRGGVSTRQGLQYITRC